MFSDRAIQLIAEAKITAAIEAGEFDNLTGLGKPFEFDDSRYDPNWWIRHAVERENCANLFAAGPTPLVEFANRYTAQQMDSPSTSAGNQ